MSAPHEDAAVLYREHLFPIWAQWEQYRAHFRLRSFPARPPNEATLRRRAQLQAMLDAERGYRVLPPVARLEAVTPDRTNRYEHRNDPA